MDNGTLRWIGGILVVVIGIFWVVVKAVGPNGADDEFKRTLETYKQVKSFRGAYNDSASSTYHSERLWEVDCNRIIVHEHARNSGGDTDSPFEMKEDELLVGDQRYVRDSNGSWQNAGYAGDRSSAKWHCARIAEGGSISSLLPDMSTLISHGITEKGDKKTVNGARCREWKFDIRTPLSSRKGAICIGVKDHLPYELTMEGGHYLYSDYNQPIEFEAPEAVLQPVSSTSGSN